MARWIGPSPEHDHIGAVLSAADAWRDQCFMADGSIFGEEALWTYDNIRELKLRLIDEPKENAGSAFFRRHEEQLRAAPPELTRLAAEVWWFLFLFRFDGDKRDIKWNTKLSVVQEMWGWSGANLSDDTSFLQREVLLGVGETGAAFTAHFKAQLGFLLDTLARWKNEPRRAELTTEDTPWGFVAWLDFANSEGNRQLGRPAMRNALLGARPDFARLRNGLVSLRYLFLLFGDRWRWLPPITTALSNSAANCCESSQPSATCAKVRSGHSTASAASPTATARSRVRRGMALTGC